MKITDGIKVGFGAIVGMEIGNFVITCAQNIFMCCVADENDESDMEIINKHCPNTYKHIKEFKEKLNH